MAITIDEYHGQGGTYLQDAKTGKRQLIERTEPAQQTISPEVTSDAAPKSETPDPGED